MTDSDDMTDVTASVTGNGSKTAATIPPEQGRATGGDAARGRGGAPAGNVNALRHGLTSGSDPPGCSFITRQGTGFRRLLEAAVVECRGRIGLYESALIQTSVSWLKHALRARHWLRTKGGELEPEQRLAFSREIARAFESRDRALRQLGLDQQQGENILDVLYSPDDGGLDSPQDPPAAEPDSKAASPANAADGATARQEGDDA